jgi:hypothetical protein
MTRETHIGTEGEDPGQGELGRADSLRFCHLVQTIHELEVLVERLALETGQTLLERTLRNVLGRLVRAGDESAAKWGIGIDGDFVLGRPSVLDIFLVGPERDLNLENRNVHNLTKASSAVFVRRCKCGIRIGTRDPKCWSISHLLDLFECLHTGLARTNSREEPFVSALLERREKLFWLDARGDTGEREHIDLLASEEGLGLPDLAADELDDVPATRRSVLQLTPTQPRNPGADWTVASRSLDLLADRVHVLVMSTLENDCDLVLVLGVL